MKYLKVKNLIILSVFWLACTQKIKKNQLQGLSPVSYEFHSGKDRNRIDYFYMEGDFVYAVSGYNALKKKVDEKAQDIDAGNYFLYSIYIYRETDIINKKYKDGKVGLDGQNRNLIAYARYRNGKADIFYMIKEAVVVYDALSDQKADFEFNQ